jgi:hypothetical protein
MRNTYHPALGGNPNLQPDQSSIDPREPGIDHDFEQNSLIGFSYQDHRNNHYALTVLSAILTGTQGTA